MSFAEAVKSVFANAFNFGGRARRSEYWYFCLFNFLASMVLGVFDRMLGTSYSLPNGASLGLIGAIFSLVVLIPSIAVSFRRIHDIGKSGWNFLFALIPFIGYLIILYWSVLDSQPGENKYGPNPKGV